MSIVSPKTGGIAQRFKERILHRYFVRCDMSLILVVVVATGVGASKLMLECGVHSLTVRYPAALFISFLAFLLLIKVWIWYVFCRPIGGVDLAEFDPGGSPISGGGGSAGADTGAVHFGGGDSGGGGASDSWEQGSGADVAPRASGSSGGGGGFDLDLGDDWAIVALAIALVLAIAGASGYLIYAAPHILPEAAWQATLATCLARIEKPSEHQGWLTVVLRSAAIPFAVVLIFVVALAWVTHRHCPSAVKLAEALYC